MSASGGLISLDQPKQLPMTRDTRIALFLMGELVASPRANDPDLLSDGCLGASKTSSGGVAAGLA